MPQKKRRTIAIVGLGQIGGSLVLAIRKKKLPFRIIGIDTSRKRLRLLARKLDETSTRWDQVKEADLVLLCLHYRQTIDFLNQASQAQLILDTCSSKKQIVSFANKRKLRFIGGHPLSGNERHAEKGWDPDLFRDVSFFVCPGRRIDAADRLLAFEFIRKLGAVPILVDADQHDRYLAKTSHFPAFLSRLIADSARSVPALFQGPGYRSMTRLSRTSPDLLATFLESNRRYILSTAKELRANLDRWIQKFTAESAEPAENHLSRPSQRPQR